MSNVRMRKNKLSFLLVSPIGAVKTFRTLIYLLLINKDSLNIWIVSSYFNLLLVKDAQ